MPTRVGSSISTATSHDRRTSLIRFLAIAFAFFPLLAMARHARFGMRPKPTVTATTTTTTNPTSDDAATNAGRSSSSSSSSSKGGIFGGSIVEEVVIFDYVPLVEVLTPSALIRSYSVSRSKYPDPPPPSPESAARFAAPRFAAPRFASQKGPSEGSREFGLGSAGENGRDKRWSKAAEKTVAQWADGNVAWERTSTVSGILTDWSFSTCASLEESEKIPYPWIAFIPCSTALAPSSSSSSIDAGTCSLQRHVIVAKRCGAIATLLYDDSGSGTYCGGGNDALLRNILKDDLEETLAAERRKNVIVGGSGSGTEKEEEGEQHPRDSAFAFAGVRNTEAVRSLVETLEDGKDWVTVNITTFTGDRPHHSSKNDDAVGNKSAQQTKKGSKKESHKTDLTSKDAGSVVAPFPYRVTPMTEKQEALTLAFVTGHVFYLITLVFVIFSIMCLLQFLMNTYSIPFLNQSLIASLVARVPLCGLFFIVDADGTGTDEVDDARNAPAPEKQNIDARVLRHFEVRIYSEPKNGEVEEEEGGVGEEGSSDGSIRASSPPLPMPLPSPPMSRRGIFFGSSAAGGKIENSKGLPSTGRIAKSAVSEHGEFIGRPVPPSRSTSDPIAAAAVAPSPLKQDAVLPIPGEPATSSEISHAPGSRPYAATAGQRVNSVSIHGDRLPRVAPKQASQKHHQHQRQPHRCFTAPSGFRYGRRGGYACTGPCPICLDDYRVGQEIRMLPCGHEYHIGCIDPWLLYASSYCPMCKTDYAEWPIPVELAPISTTTTTTATTTNSPPSTLQNFLSSFIEPYVPTSYGSWQRRPSGGGGGGGGGGANENAVREMIRRP